MANTRSAEKRTRQIEKRTARNRVYTSNMKSLRKALEAKVEAGDLDGAKEDFKKFASAVDRAKRNNIIHANKAANLKSKANAVIRKAVQAPVA